MNCYSFEELRVLILVSGLSAFRCIPTFLSVSCNIFIFWFTVYTFFFKNFKKKSYIEVYLINNVMLASSIWQSDSVIHIHVFILSQTLRPFQLLGILSRVPYAIH